LRMRILYPLSKVTRYSPFYGNITKSIGDINSLAASLSGSRQHGSQTHSEMEDDMENAVEATTILFNIMGGLGLFFTGVGVLWYVTVYKEKKE
jgi:hypothetical protein